MTDFVGDTGAESSSAEFSTHELSGVWKDLVGQDRVIRILRRAVADERHAMTHAWLFTGPPGSGRSNAAKAFAAALQCDQQGCNECLSCRTSLSGAHPDVTQVKTELLTIKVAQIRELVRRSAMAPTHGRYQVIIIEDADRITERGANALLKSIEEPVPRTVWMLCAPAAKDVVVTIASRCRQVNLVTPSPLAISELIQYRDGVDSRLADYAARVAQGHIGRARALARDEPVRLRRNEVLRLPRRLTSVGACLLAAENLIAAADAEAAEMSAELDARERAVLEEALGFRGRTKPRNAQAALRELEDNQKARATRLKRDSLDRVLTELTSYYRDILVVQSRVTGVLINIEQRVEIEAQASAETAETTLGHLDAILDCRLALGRNVAPLLAVETMLLKLRAST